jgi:hypothetical protein
MIALIISGAALLISLITLSVCFIFRRDLRRLRESGESLLAGQRMEWTAELAKLNVTRVEDSRPDRRMAMQMFRSGVSPDTVAAKLGLPKREMRLTGKVFRILAARP